MKILEITLRNLNSLRGEWKINFEDEAYKSDGIFAVTGPTGAGKTTIFDAVCLALYGRTPRLNSTPKSEIAEIMSKHTKKCTAKVKFEAGGKIYVCEWSLTKKKDTNGEDKLDTEHSINEGGQTKFSGASARVAEVTGLNFKQFTQAALLAQGEFDAFLKGNTPERAKILELLTGTEKYSDISKKIAEHAKKAKEELDTIKLQRDALTPHDDFGSDEEISHGIDETRKKISVLEAERSELEPVLSALENVKALREELVQNQNQTARLERIIAASQDKRARLEAGMKAKSIHHEYSQLCTVRRQHTQKESRIQNQKQQLEDDRSKLALAEREMKPLEAELERMTAGLPEGETPDSICAKAKIRVQAFIDTYKEKSKISSERAKAEKEHAKAKAILETAIKNDESARRNYEHARAILSELMSARVSEILEAERKKLKPGVPCPVCGSKEHPAISHYSQSEKDSEGKIVQIDGDLKTARDRENQALRLSQEAGQKLSDARNHESTSRNMLEQYMKQENECEGKITDARSAVSEVIEKIGIHNPKSCDEIISRIDAWKFRTDKLSARITETKQNIISLRGQIDANSKTLEEEISSLSAMREELESLEEKFRASLAAKNFTDEKHFTDSILTEEKISEIQTEAQRNDDEMKRLQALREDRMKRLGEEEAKAVTAMTLEEAEQLSADKDKEINALNEKLHRLEAAEETRKKLKAEYDKLNEECKDREEKYNRWEAFNKRLGQQDGGAFRKFAQRITLNMLVQLANTQLEKINSRYTLISTPKKDDELFLSVKDSEQAGEIRPTTNLSGGEKFIISLALALGLSQISGSKAQVDSLFIDEGFGSLDEEALNAALEALGEIRREGRMIGIISHISGISERIPARINVIRKSEGTSIITGPGCSREV